MESNPFPADSLAESIAVTHAGRLIGANEPFARLHGYEPAEVVGMWLSEFFAPEDQPKALDDRGEDRFEQYRGRRKGGSSFPAEACSHYFTVDGKSLRIIVVRDITEQEKARQPLRESEERFRTMADDTPLMIWVTDVQGRIEFVNRACCQFFGVTQETIQTIGWQSLVHPEDASAYVDEFVACLRERMPFHALARVRRHDGVWRWVESFGQPRFAPSGEFVGMVGNSPDITERRQSDEALRESEKRLARAQSIAHLGSWELDLIQNKLTWSDEVYRLFGLQPQEFGASYVAFLQRVHPEDRAAVDAAYTGSIREGKDSYEIEHRLVRRDGEVRWVQEKCQHARDEKGKFVASLGMVLDVTERRQAEEELRHSEARLRLLSDTAGRLLASENPQLLVNDLCREVMDYLGCDMFFNFLLDEKARRLRLNACAGIPEEEARKIEWLDYGGTVCGCVARDGSRIITEDVQHTDDPRAELVRSYGIHAYCAHPLLAQGRVIGTLSFGTRARPTFTSEEVELMRIVSDQVAVAMQRLLAQQALQSLNESLEHRVSERTAEVQHLAERLRALAADLTRTEQRERKRMATILHDNIQQLLVGARLHIGHGLNLNPEPECRASLESADGILREAVDVSRSLTVELCPPVLRDAGLIAGLGWLAQWMRGQHHCDVELICDSRAEPTDEDVRLFLFEAVRELVSNASRHSGVKVVHVSMALEEGKGTRITVEDHGSGFDPKALRHRDSSTIGFGLFSIQQRLDYLGGAMEIASSPGKGTRITLQLLTDSETAALRGEDAAIVALPAAKVQCGPLPIRVMIVDDHKVMRDGLRMVLQSAPGLLVVGEAENGEEAVEKARGLEPHIILMDVSLPKMDGIEATKIICRQYPRIRVIGLSMHIDPAIAHSMKEAGAVAYLTKGEPMETVITAIRANAGTDQRKAQD